MEKTCFASPLGCSALTLQTADERHLFARNYDFPSLSGTSVVFVPRATAISFLKSSETGTVEPARYASLGMGFLGEASPCLYDGVNECGLAGGMLYYPGFATYGTNPSAPKELDPAFCLTAVLSLCKTVDEAVDFLTSVNFSREQIVPGMNMPIHYFLTDVSGEAVVIEPDASGLSVYRHTIGVLTNAPGYPWHTTNLRNYLTVTPHQPPEASVLGLTLEPFGVGAGALGLPGDYTPPSRFVRLAFIKESLGALAHETDAVTAAFSALGAVAMPQGFVVNAGGIVEKTLYTAAIGLESRTYYCAPFSNRRITAYRLDPLLECSTVKSFPLAVEQDIAHAN